MKNYLDLLKKIMTEGTDRMDRTGIGTRALFGEMLEWDLGLGFPLVTTKAVPFGIVVTELLFFLAGYQDNTLLVKEGCNIWTDNANADYWKPKAKFTDDLGRIYGVQWRDWRSVGPDGTTKHTDQFEHLLKCLKINKTDRRMIVMAWNPGELDQMCLPACHMFFQCFVAEDKLDLMMYQRSCDTFLGVPFNIASYALLLSLLAYVSNLKPGKLKITFGDVHIYHSHWPAVIEQINRMPKQLPILRLLDGTPKDLFEIKKEHIALTEYNPDNRIKAKMAV